MSDNLHLTIDFYKIRNGIDTTTALSIDEKYEAVDKAIDIVEILTYFATNPPQPSNVIDDDSREIYLFEIRKVIEAFISYARGGIADIEKRREELEALFAQLQTTPEVFQKFNQRREPSHASDF